MWARFFQRYVEVLSVCVFYHPALKTYICLLCPLRVCIVSVCFAEVLRDPLWTRLSSYSEKKSCFLKHF